MSLIDVAEDSSTAKDYSTHDADHVRAEPEDTHQPSSNTTRARQCIDFTTHLLTPLLFIVPTDDGQYCKEHPY